MGFGMNSNDFAAWVSQLCVLNGQGSDAEFVESIRSFAAELGVKLADSDIREYFRLDETP